MSTKYAPEILHCTSSQSSVKQEIEFRNLRKISLISQRTKEKLPLRILSAESASKTFSAFCRRYDAVLFDSRGSNCRLSCRGIVAQLINDMVIDGVFSTASRRVPVVGVGFWARQGQSMITPVSASAWFSFVIFRWRLISKTDSAADNRRNRTQ